MSTSETATWFAYEGNVAINKARIVCQFTGATLTRKADFNMGVDNKTEAYKKINPFCQVPAVQLADGRGLFESNSLARYFARTGESKVKLYGNDAYEASLIDAFLDATFGFQSAIGPIIMKNYGQALSEEGEKKAIADAGRKLAELDAYLDGKNHLVGSSTSLADIIFVVALQGGAKYLPAGTAAGYPNIVRWANAHLAMEQFKAILGEVTF